MTPLEYIASNPSTEDMASKALLFSTALNDAMLAKQATVDTNHRITPILLTDGRFGIRALTLTETSAGGIFSELFNLLDQAALDTAVIVDNAEFLALIPENPEI